MSRTEECAPDRKPSAGNGTAVLVKTDERKPEGYDGTCLRPTGMCELGGSCDICWYSPDHPRFKSSQD
jgi:hypothetical protein